MKSLMLKLLTIIFLSSVTLFGANVTNEMDKKVIAFLEKAIAPNDNYKFDKVVIVKKEEMKDINGWYVYFVRIDLNLTKQAGKTASVNDMVFTNGAILSKDFLDIKTNKSIKSSFSLDLDTSAYSKVHLLAGNSNAPHKIAVFSDPLCPFCMDLIPEIIEDVEKNPQTFALYYYHFPLSIHPASPTLVKAMILAEEKGDKGIVKRVYKEILDIKESDEAVVLDIFNKTFKTNFTLKEINQAHIVKQLADDEALAHSLMLSGTPTVYLNGKKDEQKKTYRNLIKEKK